MLSPFVAAPVMFGLMLLMSYPFGIAVLWGGMAAGAALLAEYASRA